MQVGLREANQQFAKLMKRVRKGEEIILTDRGKPFARITPVSSNGAEQEDDEAFLDRLAAEGKLIRATYRGPMKPFKPVKLRGKKTMVETIREMRDERY